MVKFGGFWWDNCKGSLTACVTLKGSSVLLWRIPWGKTFDKLLYLLRFLEYSSGEVAINWGCLLDLKFFGKCLLQFRVQDMEVVESQDPLWFQRGLFGLMGEEGCFSVVLSLGRKFGYRIVHYSCSCFLEYSYLLLSMVGGFIDMNGFVTCLHLYCFLGFVLVLVSLMLFTYLYMFRWSEHIPMSPMEGCPTAFQVICSLMPGYHQVVWPLCFYVVYLNFYLINGPFGLNALTLEGKKRGWDYCSKTPVLTACTTFQERKWRIVLENKFLWNVIFLLILWLIFIL